MQFKINNLSWKIIEVEQEKFWEDDNKLNEMNNRKCYLGRCHFDKQEIWLWKKQSEEQKRKTLYHELIHCYRGSFITFMEINEQDEDFWCDIVANSHDIIHEIVSPANKFFVLGKRTTI